MKKKKLFVIIILLVLLFVPILFVVSRLYNKVQTINRNKNYERLSDKLVYKQSVIEKVKTIGYLESHSSDSYREINTSVFTKSYFGYIYFDTLNCTFKVIEKKFFGEGEVNIYLTEFDDTGTIISRKEHHYGDTINVFEENSVLLKNKNQSAADWTNPDCQLNIVHFAKKEFNMQYFNPLRGVGNSTGPMRCFAWRGEGYYDLKYNNEVLTFRADCRAQNIFSNEEGDYELNLSYYELPSDYKQKYNIGFLVYDNRAIYIIKSI